MKVKTIGKCNTFQVQYNSVFETSDEYISHAKFHVRITYKTSCRRPNYFTCNIDLMSINEQICFHYSPQRILNVVNLPSAIFFYSFLFKLMIYIISDSSAPARINQMTETIHLLGFLEFFIIRDHIMLHEFRLLPAKPSF